MVSHAPCTLGLSHHLPLGPLQVPTGCGPIAHAERRISIADAVAKRSRDLPKGAPDFQATGASRSDTASSIAFLHAERFSSVTVRGSQSPKIGLMRFHPRHQSSRVRNALADHSSVRR